MKKETLERPKTCLASARISTKKQTSGESLIDQVKAIEKFTENRGWKILPDGEVDVEVFSGAKRRPVYENHLRYQASFQYHSYRKKKKRDRLRYHYRLQYQRQTELGRTEFLGNHSRTIWWL